jgi:hypothetical protein
MESLIKVRGCFWQFKGISVFHALIIDKAYTMQRSAFYISIDCKIRYLIGLVFLQRMY